MTRPSITQPAAPRAPVRAVVDRGPIHYQQRDLVLLDRAGAAAAPQPPGGWTVHVRYPPRRTEAESVTRLIAQRRPHRLLAAGDGATLDVAKYAWLAAGGGPVLVLAPVGAEPWRAFAPFTSLYEPDGGRVSRPDQRLASARVVVDPVALAQRPDRVTRLHRADSTVHAVELLLNTAARDRHRALARAGLSALDSAATGDDVVGAGLITEGFAPVGLGLAHAVASPLGARAGRTHDTVNVIAAPYVMRYWGDRIDWSTVAAALGTPAAAEAVAGALADRCAQAGLAGCLREAGFTRDEVLAVVPAALRSSGIPRLPRPTTAAEITRLLERAWAGS